MSTTANKTQSKPTGKKEEDTNNKTASAIPTLGILEEDDEFEEFPVEDWDEAGEDGLDIEQWEADWDDDYLGDEFSLALRRELERNIAEQAVKNATNNVSASATESK